MLPGRQPPPRRGGFAVVDVEATGRSPWRHRMVEVGVVLLDGRLRPEGEFATLIDPAGPVGPTHVHHIHQDDVVGAPRFRELAPLLLELLGGRVLVGHHVSCDRAFLEREFARIGVPLPAVPALCTLRLARARLPGAGGYGLTACVRTAGLGEYAAHTALGDARATADLFRHLAGPAARAEWQAPLREAAGLPWPRLGSAPSRRGCGPLPLVRREALPGPRPLGAPVPTVRTGPAPVGPPVGPPVLPAARGARW
ncbi:exonuclease domain-containing protein [Kitasatospora sp. NPDC096147]|uniref:3'-5' exonuclease n=1 Tax=Kitasatospora sp. NPDC096147 TaxID=3364093 RepID=UPI0038105E1E